jgi:hypothetical protein
LQIYVGGMPSFLVETYLPRGRAEERAVREQQARSASEELTREGTSVRFERVIHVPEDETCFFVFEADSGQGAALAAERAGIEPFRVVGVVVSGSGGQEEARNET